MLLGEENTDFSLEAPYVCFCQADYPQITLMDLHHEPGPDSFSLTSWFAVLAAEQCTEPVHIAEEVWRCPSSCPVKAHVHQTQHLLPWGHTPQGALSHEWAIAFWGIRSHWCWWEIWHWLWCLLFPDLCDHRTVIQISVQRLGFLSSSHMYHAKSKLKKRKISPANIFFLQSFPAVLAPVLVLPM